MAGAHKDETLMKRDINIVRELLLRSEAAESPFAVSGVIETYHVRLMIDAGLIDGRISEEITATAHNAWINRLTWAGHEFLDAARDEVLWRRVRDKFRPESSWTFGILLELLKAEIRAGVPGM